MRKRVVAVGLGFAIVAVGAAAQSAAPPPDRAGMERALQQADGPKRRILEASRLKAGPAPVAVPLAAAPVAGSAPAPVAAVALPPRAEAPPAAATPAPDSAIVVVVTMPAGIEPVALPAPAFVRSVGTVAPLSATPPQATLIDLPPPPAAASPPRLQQMVEPELSARLFKRGATRSELLLDLVIGTDGRVTSAAVRESANIALDEAVLAAVRQWRYDPHPAPRTHTVRLVVALP